MTALPRDNCRLVPMGECPTKAVEIRADGKGCIIGRSAGATLHLEHPSISRQHASVHFQNERWTVTDLGSRHGTLLNGVALAARNPMPLRNGDRISLAPWTLRFEVGAAHEETVIGSSDDGGFNAIQVVAESRVKNEAQRQLNLLINASVAICAAANEAELAVELTRACVEGTRCERALLVRLLAGDNRVEVVGCWPADALKSRPVSRTLVRAASQGKPVRLTEDSSFVSAQSIAGTGVNGALCIPIMIDEQVTSFLYIDQLDLGKAFEDVSAFSQALGRLTGFALMKVQRAELESRQRDLLEELAGARRVQERMMGSSNGAAGGVHWRMLSIPGQVVAGDIFGIHTSKSTAEKVTVFLGDVTGKGLGPGLLMAAITAHLEAQLSGGVDASKAIFDLSNFVNSRAAAGQFATFALAEFHPASRRVDLFDAGHGYFTVVQSSGRAKAIEVDGGVPIGVVEDFEYVRNGVKLDVGDRLVFFSDGLAEQHNRDGIMLGSDRVASALLGSRSCGEDVSRLEDLLKKFADGLAYTDDVTIASVMLASDVTDVTVST
ncbi:MAG: FHA domain-containing protein [Phycisphaerales bacterium]|nr:FHA domain-containing protein [Phycisphaerales bacterium]